MASAPRDRFLALQAPGATLNGIDFVEVDAADPTVLRVHFLNAVAVTAPGLTARIEGGDSIPIVKTRAINAGSDWSADGDGRPLLTLQALGAGDFSNYNLTLEGSPTLDRMFRSARFSFKVLCPSDFDCADAGPCCPPDDTPPPPIDYLAKDFLSFRQALTDFSALRYPAWVERSEADFGMMFAEALSALADELSYQQDRIAAEATLETATQRRSLVSLARLVDYEPRPATSATTVLLCDVAAASVLAGAQVSAVGADGGLVPFEVGKGLADASGYAVSPNWNYGLRPYWWDDDDRCLPRGATEMWLEGDGHGFVDGMRLLIQTDLPGDSIRQVVRLLGSEEDVDLLFPPASAGTPVTRIWWGEDDRLLRERDLTLTLLGGNLLPATQGVRMVQTAAIDVRPLFAPSAPLAIARRGPNGDDARPNFVHRIPLAHAPVAWLAGAGADPDAKARPEVMVSRTMPTAAAWNFAHSLLDADSLEEAFTVDPVAWRPVAHDLTGAPSHWDIDGDQAESVRFGDGVFGAAPAEGDLYEVRYRVGLGARGNVPADSVTQVDPSAAGMISACRNPFPAEGGADAESPERVRRLAPQAFRARQFRAVTRDDYADTAEELKWVQQAGAAFRWTGSWLTVFTAADPLSGGEVSGVQHLELVRLLNRRRLAGYESYAPQPRHVSVDLKVKVCVRADSLPATVEKAVLDRLGSSRRCDGAAGFFFGDHFTFGSPLERSRLEAAIQEVPGVAGVLSITYRRRGATAGFVELPAALDLGADEILRIDNDPDWPERGIIEVMPEGGR